MSMIYDQPMSDTDWKKERERKQKALEARLKKLPQNELVREIKEEKQEHEMEQKKWEEWEIVDKLVHEARCMYMEDEKPFKDVVSFLGEAITALKK